MGIRVSASPPDAHSLSPGGRRFVLWMGTAYPTTLAAECANRHLNLVECGLEDLVRRAPEARALVLEMEPRTLSPNDRANIARAAFAHGLLAVLTHPISVSPLEYFEAAKQFPADPAGRLLSLYRDWPRIA